MPQNTYTSDPKQQSHSRSCGPVQSTKELREQPGQALTNDSIVKLLKAGFSDQTIISLVERQPGSYAL
ncbi:MAG: hypothetical protein DMG21_03235 [Acidobacteria bacterium]|nr:MAG: hypothetical protein DMG21_03235 [Acidobacteriota bacterium]